MNLLRLLPALLCLLVASLPAAAQETTDTGWPIEERCIGEPTQPPDGWTFPGTILMTGHYGIHAVSADFETPHVVAFIPTVPRYGAETVNAVLSPDQRWLAVTNASKLDGGLWVILSIYEIVVYSTVTPHESHVIPWKARFDRYDYTPRWIDSQRLIYESPGRDDVNHEYLPEEAFIINPFTQEITKGWKGRVDPFHEYSSFVSPDWTRTVYETQWWDTGWDATVDWGIYDELTGNKLASLPLTLKYPGIAWSPDSAHFVALAGKWEQDQKILLVDRDGQLSDILLNVAPDEVIDSGYGTQVFRWTSDSRYVTFRIGTQAIPRTYELYIADVETKHIFKTCTDADGLASPDGKLLAISGLQGNPPPLMILDLNTWQLYTVAYHDGSIIGWRGD